MDKTNILAETRFYFAQCVFCASSQYAAATRYRNKQQCMQKIGVTISAFTILGLVISIVCWESQCNVGLKILSYVGAFLTFASLVFELWTKEDYAYLKFSHQQAAEDYKSLRDQFMDLIRCIKEDIQDKTLGDKLQMLLHDYSLIGKYSPSTNYDDYCNAQRNLGLKGVGETFTWSDEEIDKFLPHQLTSL